MAKRVAIMLGYYDIYLWNEMMRPDSDMVFVGDARNVVACYFICQQMGRLLKAVRLNWRKQKGPWGSRAELDETARRYMVRKLNRPFLSFLTMNRGEKEPHVVGL